MDVSRRRCRRWRWRWRRRRRRRGSERRNEATTRHYLPTFLPLQTRKWHGLKASQVVRWPWFSILKYILPSFKFIYHKKNEESLQDLEYEINISSISWLWSEVQLTYNFTMAIFVGIFRAISIGLQRLQHQPIVHCEKFQSKLLNSFCTWHVLAHDRRWSMTQLIIWRQIITNTTKLPIYQSPPPSTP